ncbi:maleylacetoacetate isomerase [Paraburkholderia sp.]|jgi:maleylpyruvate isomerase|uniref:maleylacetoacetate isomerase n=1 Tax=Paraburkholderia sp. TaxID=1926495 RepID=UPI003C3809E0
MKLYNYFRSTSSYRVRIACNLKGLSYEYIPVHLNRNGGEQFAADFSSLNPQQLVPLLIDGTLLISQSLAIIEYLDECYPDVALLPTASIDRVRVRQLSQYIACEMHPLNNLRVLKYLTGPLQLSTEQKQAWTVHWLRTGLEALERELDGSAARGKFCFGNTPTMADCCLVPQLYSARRFGIDVDAYPALRAIDAECQTLDAFQAAHPDRQPDAE